MTVGAKVFAGAATFSLVAAVIYWITADEPAGTALLLAMGAASSGLFLFLVRRDRAGRMPADEPTARMEDAAGEDLGVFPSGSAVPILLATSCLVVATGAVFGLGVLILGILGCVGCLVVLVRQSG